MRVAQLPNLLIVHGIDYARGGNTIAGAFDNYLHVDYFGWMWRMALGYWCGALALCCVDFVDFE